MNRRKFLAFLSLAPLAAAAPRASRWVPIYLQRTVSGLFTKTHAIVTLYAGAEGESLIDANAQKIRMALAAINVQTQDLDAIDTAYRRSVRQRFASAKNVEKLLTSQVIT